jgi:hypothetical protein
MTTKAVAYIFPPQTWIQVGGMDEGAELGHVVSHPEGSQEAQSLATKCVQNRGLFCMHLGVHLAAQAPPMCAVNWRILGLILGT